MTGDPLPTGPTRQPPGPVGRWFARAPRYLYRAGLGRLLGERFVLIEHIGRKSGLTRETVVEVIGRDQAFLEVAAAWGTESDWYRNIVANPDVLLSTGRRRRLVATAEIVGSAEAADVFARYRQRHPRAARALGKTLGLPMDDEAAMAAAVPVVRFSFGP